MSTPSCWRCLARPTNAVALPIRNLAPVAAPHGTAAFSTTTAVANTKAGTPGGSVGLRYRQRTAASATAHKMRSKNITHQKSPLPGERKAWRKRIVLSNNNSLEVAGLEDLSAENIADPEAAGVMRIIPGELVDQLRAVESFKPSQTWPLFRKPSLLVRAETPLLVGKLNGGVDAKKTSRIVVSGERLAGKSMMLLQAAANGFLNDWIVINIPEAQELTTAVTEYAPVPGSEPMQYAQHVYVHKLLQAMAKASGRVLSKYQAAFDHPKLTHPVKAGDSLLELVNSAKEAEQAWPVFAALWAELTTPNAETARPPVLVTVDGIAHIMRMSEYRSAAFELIHAHDLALVRNIVDVLSGKTTFAAGGAVVAATSRGNQPKCLSLELAVNQRLAEQNGTEPPARVAHVKGYDARADEVLKTVEVINIKGVNKAEARSLMEYWAASGLLRETVTELGIASTWMLGGSGVIGEMERAALLSLRPGRA